jgi:hypothetical protein
MAVAMLVDNPEGSQETYDRVRERLGLKRPAGGIFHVGAPPPPPPELWPVHNYMA